MDKLTSIIVTEFSKFAVDTKTNEVVVPQEYELYKKLTIEDQIKTWQEEIAQYAAEKEPTTEELIELGKSMHQYYMNQERKLELIERIKSYEVKVIEPIIKK